MEEEQRRKMVGRRSRTRWKKLENGRGGEIK